MCIRDSSFVVEFLFQPITPLFKILAKFLIFHLITTFISDLWKSSSNLGIISVSFSYFNFISISSISSCLLRDSVLIGMKNSRNQTPNLDHQVIHLFLQVLNINSICFVRNKLFLINLWLWMILTTSIWAKFLIQIVSNILSRSGTSLPQCSHSILFELVLCR